MSTLTPNFGLIVPEATDTVAQVRADYATNLNTIDENLGGGGGGGGGGNVYGTFIDTNRIITSGSYSLSLSYTATEDCFLYTAVALNSNTGGSCAVDGETVSSWWNGSGGTVAEGIGIYLKSGQTFTATATNSSSSGYYVYGVTQGTKNIFTPIIYSDNERCIGIWRDNKPLYQRSFPLTVSLSGGQTATIATLSGVENIIHASGWLNENNIVYFLNDYSARIKISASGELQLTSATGSSWNGSGYITLQYTKTADVAGSGNWNTDGVPTVHYSTSEQVIGTWIDGKPLYQITVDVASPVNDSNEHLIDLTSLSIEECPYLFGYAVRHSGANDITYYANSIETDSWYYFKARYDNFRDSIMYTCLFRNDSISRMRFTIQYTKTTD